MGLLEPSESEWAGVEGHLDGLVSRLVNDHRLIDLPPVRHGEELRIERWKHPKHFPCDPKEQHISIGGVEEVSVSLPLAILDEISEIAQERRITENQVLVELLMRLLNDRKLRPSWALFHFE